MIKLVFGDAPRVLPCPEGLDASEAEQNPEAEAGEQELVPDAAEFQEAPALAVEVAGLPTVKTLRHAQGNTEHPVDCKKSALGTEHLDPGRQAIRFLLVEAGEPEGSFRDSAGRGSNPKAKAGGQEVLPDAAGPGRRCCRAPIQAMGPSPDATKKGGSEQGFGYSQPGA